MMSLKKIASRYARSFFNFSKEKNILKRTITDMKLILQTIKQSNDLRFLLEVEVIRDEKSKLKGISKVFSKNISDTTLLFLNFLAFKKRVSYLKMIAQTLISLDESEKNIAYATVYSAIPLKEVFKKSLKKKLDSRYEKNFYLKEKLDLSLIGGISLQIGDSFFDGSLKASLDSFKEKWLS